MNKINFYPNNSLEGSQGSIKYITHKDWVQICQSLKLQELVKERIKSGQTELGGGIVVQGEIEKLLQSLVEESEKK